MSLRPQHAEETFEQLAARAREYVRLHPDEDLSSDEITEEARPREDHRRSRWRPAS